MAVNCPNCGKEFKNNRALHPHLKFHCKKSPETASAESTCQHDWKMLRAEYGQPFAAAMQQGYKKFCDNCGEVE